MEATTEPRWLTDDEQVVWRSFTQLQGQLAAALNRQLQTTSELSTADFGVLVHLSDAPAGRERAFVLARALQWEKSRLSHHLSRMERRGLITRTECPTDARGAFVVLSSAGRSALERAAPGHVTEVRRLIFDALTPEQVAALGTMCEVILGQLADVASCCDGV